MIHKNIYSNRFKDFEEVDPYIYEINGKEEIINSFMMLFAKLDDEILEPTLIDFCETKRSYISEKLEKFILLGMLYNIQDYMKDLYFLLKDYRMEDILDFLDILIANFNLQIVNHRDYNNFGYLPEHHELIHQAHYKNSFIEDLNETFRHNNLGFQVVNDVVVTKKSDYLHQEVIVKPLTLLVNEDFQGALKEFTNAIDNYTKGDYENTILEACKAYESTIKSILDKLNVTYKKGAKIYVLLELLQENNIFDPFLSNMYSNINPILTSGVNAIRNNKAGHGDGLNKNEVERSYASFAINLAGSNIVFLIDRLE